MNNDEIAIRLGNMSGERRKREQNQKQIERTQQRALKASLNAQEIKVVRNKKRLQKKQFKKILRQTLAISLAAATIALTSYGSVKITQKITDRKYVLVPKTEASEEINDRVNYYRNLMNLYADETTRIETSTSGRNPNYINDGYVDYTDQNIENLANHLINAATEGEVELRCAVLAAYREINEPYRNKVLEEGFKKAVQKEESQDTCLNDFIKEKNGSYTKGFLGSLGYEDWQEYHLNERNNIKETRAIEEFKQTRHKGV